LATDTALVWAKADPPPERATDEMTAQ
jgi:hypothetical protein